MRVTFATDTPTPIFQSEMFSPHGAAGPYTWGASAADFNILASSNGASYRVTFEFLNGAPDPRELLLVVAGLADGTKVEVSQPGSLAGEYHFPSSQLHCGSIGTCPNGSSPTVLNLTSDTPCSSSTFIVRQCLTSGHTSGSGTDIQNTGWALFQATNAINVSRPTGLPTLTVTVNQADYDGIGFTLGYATVPNACCPPFDKNIMLEQLALTQTGNVLGTISYSFLNSSPYKNQIQAYLDYLHSLNPAITNISVQWSVFDLGPAGPGTSPSPTGPPVPGSPAYTTWGCTGCSSGGGGNLTYPEGPEPTGGYPIITGLQPNEWYGFSILISLNNSIQFWMESCSTFTATFDVYADPDQLARVRNPHRIAVEVREPGATSGRVVMLPLNLSGEEGPSN